MSNWTAFFLLLLSSNNFLFYVTIYFGGWQYDMTESWSDWHIVSMVDGEKDGIKK